MNRFILHCDIDCFYAAIEVRDNLDYKGKPLVIGADPKEGKGRGVVLTCSYEARKYGIRSATPISKAYKLYPDAIFLKPNFEKYIKASKEVMSIIKSYSKEFQQGGLDEAYIDVSEICSNFDEVRTIAEKIKHEVIEKVGITISIGCASTKSIAKIASDYNKPDGLTVVEPENVTAFLKDLDITCISGIGKKTKLYFYDKGIRTIGDVIKIPLYKMIELFGKYGKWVWEVAQGLDNRPVKEFHHVKSISKERTFYEDTDNYNSILSTFEQICETLTKKTVKHDISYKTITIKIRFEGYQTYTRSKTFTYPIQDKFIVFATILELYQKFSSMKKKIRLVGIKLSNFEKNPKVKQTTLLKFVNA